MFGQGTTGAHGGGDAPQLLGYLLILGHPHLNDVWIHGLNTCGNVVGTGPAGGHSLTWGAKATAAAGRPTSAGSGRPTSAGSGRTARTGTNCATRSGRSQATWRATRTGRTARTGRTTRTRRTARAGRTTSRPVAHRHQSHVAHYDHIGTAATGAHAGNQVGNAFSSIAHTIHGVANPALATRPWRVGCVGAAGHSRTTGQHDHHAEEQRRRQG